VYHRADRPLLDAMSRLPDVPIAVVQGRHEQNAKNSIVVDEMID